MFKRFSNIAKTFFGSQFLPVEAVCREWPMMLMRELSLFVEHKIKMFFVFIKQSSFNGPDHSETSHLPEKKNLFSSKSPLRSICPIYLRSISQAESKLQPNSHSKDVHSIRKMLNSDFNHVKNMSFSTFAAKNVFIQFVARSISSRLIEF